MDIKEVGVVGVDFDPPSGAPRRSTPTSLPAMRQGGVDLGVGVWAWVDPPLIYLPIKQVGVVGVGLGMIWVNEVTFPHKATATAPARTTTAANSSSNSIQDHLDMVSLEVREGEDTQLVMAMYHHLYPHLSTSRHPLEVH